MRLLGYFLLACVLLSLMQAVIAAAVVVYVGLLLWGLIFRPTQTLGFVGLCLFLRAFETHPVATICVIGCLIAIVLKQKRAEPGLSQSPRGSLAISDQHTAEP